MITNIFGDKSSTMVNFFKKIRLSFRFGSSLYLISVAYSLPAAVIIGFDPALAPICVLVKLFLIPALLYLSMSLARKDTIYFYLNLGVSRAEYYAIPVIVEFVFFIILTTISICVGNVIR